jgi:hypothetical protein
MTQVNMFDFDPVTGRGGFYHYTESEDKPDNIPSTAVRINEDKYNELLTGLNSNQLVYIDDRGDYQLRPSNTILVDGVWVINPTYEAQQQQREQQDLARKYYDNTTQYELPSFRQAFEVDLDFDEFLEWRRGLRQVIKGDTFILPSVPDFVQRNIEYM